MLLPLNASYTCITNKYNGIKKPENSVASDNFVSQNNFGMTKLYAPSFRAAILPQLKLFKYEAMTEKNPNWINAISRQSLDGYDKTQFKNDFEQDKHRIMYSETFDRLRYKTQVFPLPTNDMITTRSSHVLQVTDVARTISRRLGLNEELVEAIGLGHDLGHSPFGHAGERALKTITQQHNLPTFWHEKNGTRFADKIITFTDEDSSIKNIDLSYAVRDGIINHCGEVDDDFIKPRKEFINLEEINKRAQVQPYTWEAIVVKISDKIAYLARDIEDAKKLGIFSDKNLEDIKNIIKSVKPDFNSEINETSIKKLFIDDIVNSSYPTRGIGFSQPVAKIMKDLRKYNTDNVYKKDEYRCMGEKDVERTISTIFNHLLSMYNAENTIDLLPTNIPTTKYFKEWLIKYSENANRSYNDKNEIIYDLKKPNDYKQAIVDYIAGMTDRFALNTYNQITQG